MTPMAIAEQRDWTSWVQEYIEGSDNADFKAYLGNKSAFDERYVWMTRHLVELGRMQNGRVLDIGCGFGWDAVAISLQANATVVANDIRPEMTSVVESRVEDLKKRGANVKVETSTGDICGNIGLPEGSFDAIICQQAIEHIHDLEALYRACFRLLKPGGRVILTNDDNVLNRAKFLEAQEMWKRRDTDWEFIEALKKERPIENRDIQPYAVMRRDIVLRANPGLAEGDVTKIVDATAGLTSKEIEPLARSYSSGQKLPTPPHSSWCRNPVTGEYCERHLNPFELAEDLAAQGFVAEVRHGFRKWPLNWLNRTHIRWLDTMLFNFRPFFMIVGVKPKHDRV
jgi:SAM-dependent methyltransferase